MNQILNNMNTNENDSSKLMCMDSFGIVEQNDQLEQHLIYTKTNSLQSLYGSQTGGADSKNTR